MAGCCQNNENSAGCRTDHSFSANKTHTIIKFYKKKIEFNHSEKENRSNVLTVTKPIKEYVTKSLRDPSFVFFF